MLRSEDSGEGFASDQSRLHLVEGDLFFVITLVFQERGEVEFNRRLQGITTSTLPGRGITARHGRHRCPLLLSEIVRLGHLSRFGTLGDTDDVSDRSLVLAGTVLGLKQVLRRDDAVVQRFGNHAADRRREELGFHWTRDSPVGPQFLVENRPSGRELI